MTNRRYRITATLLLAALALSGCDSIPFIDNTSEYKGASRGKPLEVPPDLTAAPTSDTYSVPGMTYSEYTQAQAGQVAQEEKILPNPDGVRMERSGSQRWLVVQAPPEKIWPVVREFWTELGFAVRVENPQTGVMETEWIDPADLTKDEKGNYLDKFQGWLDKLNALSNRKKFRTRIDRGDDENTTEIYLSHQSVSNVPDDGKVRVRTIAGEIETGYRREDFDKRKSSPDARAIAEDIDAELLRRLMVKLGVAEQQSRAIVANPVQEKRATLNKDNTGNLTLALNDQFDRAWRRVGLALDRIGFLVEDKDRSRGIFYVRYSDVDIDDAPEKKKGLLDALKFWGNDEEDKKANSKPKQDDKGLTDKLKFWKDDKAPANTETQYRVKVERAENGSTVYIANKDGEREQSGTANRILSMLYDQLK